MKAADLDQLLYSLAKAMFANDPSFQDLVRNEAGKLSIEDLDYLRKKLPDPPPIPTDIKVPGLALASWKVFCQHIILQLIYHLDNKAIGFLRSVAFGDYDWAQSNALETLCRFYADGKIDDSIIEEIDARLRSMRYETHLNFVQALVARSYHEPRFNDIIRQFKSIDFKIAMAALGKSDPMTREELIELGIEIIAADGTEEEIQKMMKLFDKHIPYPNGSYLFFYPENYDPDTDDIPAYNPSVEEVVDKCLSYKTIIL